MSAGVRKAFIIKRLRAICCYARVKSFTVAIIVLMVIQCKENWQILMSALGMAIKQTVPSHVTIQMDHSIVPVKVDMSWMLLMDQLVMVLCLLYLSQFVAYFLLCV